MQADFTEQYCSAVNQHEHSITTGEHLKARFSLNLSRPEAQRAKMQAGFDRRCTKHNSAMSEVDCRGRGRDYHRSIRLFFEANSGHLGLVARHVHLCFQARKMLTQSDEPQLGPPTPNFKVRNGKKLSLSALPVLRRSLTVQAGHQHIGRHIGRLSLSSDLIVHMMEHCLY